MMGGIMRACLLEAWGLCGCTGVLQLCVFYWDSGQIWDSIVQD